MKNLEVVIITGLSGSGKSTVVKALEDLGFFCVDNLPVVLLPKLLELCNQSSEEIIKVAMVMDIREGKFLDEYPEIFQKLKNFNQKFKILFLEASDDILIRRFNETRRRHPIQGAKTVIEGLSLEREKLSRLKKMADIIIDTSNFNIHQLREKVIEYFSKEKDLRQMNITLLSFGYRYGIPSNVDLLIDVRFLPNPNFIDELKNLSGEDQKVIEFVCRNNEASEFIKRGLDLIKFLLPLYKKEGKAYLTIAFGCTGGRHRSVAIAKMFQGFLIEGGFNSHLINRDISK